MEKICTKYTIMKIRNKISYQAFLDGKSILEHFFTVILKSYQKFQKDEIVPLDKKVEELNDLMIEKVQFSDYGLIKVLMGRKMIQKLER